MDVAKVVDFVARIPKHLDLYFSDFSTILYKLSKFAVLKFLYIFAFSPLETLLLLTWGPWSDQKQSRAKRPGFRRACSPAAREMWGKRERASSRTCRWSRGSRGGPDGARRREARGGGGSGRGRRRSGGHGQRWLGLGAPFGRGEAVPEVGWSRGRAEEGSPQRGRGGGGPAHRRRRSGVAGRR